MANRVVIGKIPSLQLSIDDRYSRRLRAVLGRECTPGKGSNAHGPEVVTGDDSIVRYRILTRRWRRTSLDGEPGRLAIAGKWQRARSADSGDVRQCRSEERRVGKECR